MRQKPANTATLPGVTIEDRPFFRWRDAPSWASSLGLHAVALIALSMIHYEVGQQVVTAIDSVFNEDEIDRYQFDTTMTDQVGTDSSINSMAASQEAATAVGEQPQEVLQSKVDETLDVEVPMADEVLAPPSAEILNAVNTTGGTEHTGGVEGSIDRIAFEIGNSLREKKTLVIWLFDVSPSLREKREAIATRVENVYNQLTALNVGADKALKTVVGVFGERTKFLSEDPLDTTDEVVKTVRGIKSEESGKENVFAAVREAATRYQTYRTKQNRAVMLVVVTDEAGSDDANLEGAIAATRRYGMKVFCIGEEAPLGRKQVEVEFIQDNGEVIIGVMDRGPENFYQDRLVLPYWTPAQDLDNIASGFGPYGLTRLCAETNGLFFISAANRDVAVDPIVMRSYSPDYRPIPIVQKDIQANGAKRLLVELSAKVFNEPIPVPTTFFPAENDNVLREAITESQKPLAVLDYRLDEMLRALQAGEKDRLKIQEPRWQAVYDLALGRIMAMRVRSYGYNLMLAEMKATPKSFQTQSSNAWRLVPSKEITSGAAAKKLGKQAEELLKRVIDTHAGTPWAKLAEREYQTPLGWEWKEAQYNPQPMGAMGEEKARPRIIEEVDPKTGKKIKRTVGGPPPKKEI